MIHKNLMSAGALMNNNVKNYQGDDIGSIEDFVLELSSGKITHAILSFGGFLSLGSKYFAIPWESLRLDQDNKVFKLNVDEETLKNSPGFDKNDLPNFTDPSFLDSVDRSLDSRMRSTYDSTRSH